MFRHERISDLERRQDELVLQSDVHRHVLALESAAWAQRLAWVEALSQPASRPRRWLIPAALLGGVLAARGWRTLVRWLPIGLLVWRWLRRLRAAGLRRG
jgi:hypothetical protein